MTRKPAVAVLIIGLIIAAAILIPNSRKSASEKEAGKTSVQKGGESATASRSDRATSARGLSGPDRLSDSRSSSRATSSTISSPASASVAEKSKDEPIWFLDIASVDPGSYPYWLVRDDAQITDPLNAVNVNPDKRSVLHYPLSHAVEAVAPSTATASSVAQSPQNAGNKKVRFLYKGRLQRSLLFISDFRGEWWGIDEFKAQNAAAQANWQEILKDPKLGSISGVVIDPGRRPISGARVRAVKGWTHLRTVECDREGRFRIDRLQPGDITLSGRAFGFMESDGQPASVITKASTSTVEIVLKPTSIIMGKVTDESGKPVAHAEIVAASKSAKGYGFMGTLGPSVFTDTAGVYSHGSLNEGKYEFLAKAKDYAQAVHLNILVGPGQRQQQINFVLNEGAFQPGHVVQKLNDKDEPAPGVTVQLLGKAVDENGKPAELAKIVQTTTSGEDGSFTALHVPYNTDIRCWAEPQNMDPTDRELAVMDSDFYKKVSIKLAKGATPAPITLRLPETGMIFGKVVDPEKKPVKDATVALAEASITPMVPITRPIEEKQSKSQKTDASGQFSIKGLSPKTNYVVRAEASGFAATFTDKISPSKNEIEIVLSRGGALKGKVVHGDTKQPVVGISLKAVMENSSRAFKQDAVSGPDGTFRFSSIPVGQYRIAGRGPENAKELMVVQPQINIRVEEGREADLTLLAWPGLAIRGFVRDSAAKGPVANAKITAKWQSVSGAFSDLGGGNWMSDLIQSSMPFSSGNNLDSLGLIGSATSDDKGAFEFTGLAFGKWELGAKSDKHTDASLTIEVPKSQSAENVEILMASGGSIKGIVLDVAGKPIPKIHIMVQVVPNLTNLTNFQNLRKETTAGDDGRFALGGLPSGKYIVMAVSGQDRQIQSEPVDLSLWKPNADIILQEKISGVSGKVTDAEGNPVELAILVAMSAKNMMRPGGQAFTDQDGHYSIKNMAPGEYSIHMMRNMAMTGESKKVTVVEGKLLENVDFVLGSGKSLHGLVLDLSAKPMSGWTIQAIAQSATAGGGSMDEILNSSMNIQSTASDGKFKVEGLKEGKYYLQIMQIDFGNMGQMVFKSDAFDPSDEEQIFILPVGGEVRGRLVTGAGNTPIPVANFSLELKNKYNTMQPRGKLCISQGYLQQKKSQTLSDGRFQFATLPVGTYDLQIGSDRYGNKQIQKIEVSSEAPTELGDIVLSQGKTLTGRLIDGSNDMPYAVSKSPIPGLQAFGVQAFATRASGEETRLEMVSEGSDGRFRIPGAPSDIASLMIYSPDHLLLEIPSLPQSQTDTVNLGDVRLPAGGTVECTIRGANGQPSPMAIVIAVCEGKKMPAGVDLDLENVKINGFFKFSMPFGDESGKAVIKGLYPGPAYLRIIDPTSRKAVVERKDITIQTGAPTVVDIQLPGAGAATPTPK